MRPCVSPYMRQGACVTICYYAGIQLCGLRDATALFFTSPLWTLLLECIVRKKLPGPATALGAVTTGLGALFISKVKVQRCHYLAIMQALETQKELYLVPMFYPTHH